LIQSGHNEDAEDVVKSEISEIRQRNKLIKIANRHGWDTGTGIYITSFGWKTKRNETKSTKTKRNETKSTK
jgi:hypothetical protein